MKTQSWPDSKLRAHLDGFWFHFLKCNLQPYFLEKWKGCVKTRNELPKMVIYPVLRTQKSGRLIETWATRRNWLPRILRIPGYGHKAPRAIENSNQIKSPKCCLHFGSNLIVIQLTSDLEIKRFESQRSPATNTNSLGPYYTTSF